MQGQGNSEICVLWQILSALYDHAMICIGLFKYEKDAFELIVLCLFLLFLKFSYLKIAMVLRKHRANTRMISCVGWMDLKLIKA